LPTLPQILLPERGHLKIAKTTTDALQWRIQDVLIETCFQYREMAKQPVPAVLEILKRQGERQDWLGETLATLGKRCIRTTLPAPHNRPTEQGDCPSP
jgi:hypothetical protein